MEPQIWNDESMRDETPENERSGTPRGEQEVDPAREAYIKEWDEKIREAKIHWDEKAFKNMRAWAAFARGKQWPQQMTDDDRYRANLTLRHINQKVAAIYAKNPKVIAEPRPKMCYTQWDGSKTMLNEAMLALTAQQNPQMVQQAIEAGVTKQPSMQIEDAQQVMVDYAEGLARKRLYKKMAEAVQIVAQYSLDEPIPKFKTQAKQCVRRTTTTGVGYCKLGYQRITGPTSPDVEGRLKDVRDRLQHLDRMKADMVDGLTDADEAEVEALRANLVALEKQQSVILREGLVFTWPRSWAIIPDTNTHQLKGFIGAEWVAEEFLFSVKKVQEMYGKDISGMFQPYHADGTQKMRKIGDTDRDAMAAVYEIYDLVGQVTFTIAAGYNDYLVEPKSPDIDIEQGHPFFVLTFNDCEDDENPYPPSDVEMMIPMQREYNRAREGWRNHRIANRPAWMAPEGVFGDDTKTRLATHIDHEIIEHTLPRDTDMERIVQPKPTQKLDFELYDVEPLYADIQRVGGRQAANLGGTAGATATEVGIAEASRSEGDQSNVDDLDEFLTELMRAAGKALLLYMNESTVKKIAGEGAVWPQMRRQEIAEELVLNVRAGSSGRPNKQGRLMAIEKGAPLLMQIPELEPRELARIIIETMDDTLDIDDFYKADTPSITQMNSAKQALESAQSGVQGPAGYGNAAKPEGSAAKTQNLGPAPGEAPQQSSAGGAGLRRVG